MRYCDLEELCRPVGVGVRGCPHDGLGCTGGEKCGINSPDERVRTRAWTATTYADFTCQKRLAAKTRNDQSNSA